MHKILGTCSPVFSMSCRRSGTERKMRFLLGSATTSRELYSREVITENLVCIPAPPAGEIDRGYLEAAEQPYSGSQIRESQNSNGHHWQRERIFYGSR